MFSAGEASQPLSLQQVENGSNRLSNTIEQAARSFRHSNGACVDSRFQRPSASSQFSQKANRFIKNSDGGSSSNANRQTDLHEKCNYTS